MKSTLTFILGFFLVQFSFAADDETCAIMIGDEIDPEEFSEVAGKKFISVAVLASKLSMPTPLITSKPCRPSPRSLRMRRRRSSELIRSSSWNSATARFTQSASSTRTPSSRYTKARKFTFGLLAPFAVGNVIPTNTLKKPLIVDT